MTTIGAKRRSTERDSWIATVDGAEIQGFYFNAKIDALAFAKRVAEYEKGSQNVETICEGAPQYPRLRRLR